MMPKSKGELAKRPSFEGPAIFELPVPQILSVNVLIRPRPASETLGSGVLIAADRTKKADLAVRTVGQVVALGAQAFKAGTRDLDPLKDPIAQQIAVGAWVAYRQHAGQKFRVKRSQDAPESTTEYLVLLTDTDVLALFENEAQAAQFYDWLG